MILSYKKKYNKMMIHKVQVATPEEIERNEKIRKEQDKCCHNIMIFIGWSICLLIFVYLIVLIIMISFE